MMTTARAALTILFLNTRHIDHGTPSTTVRMHYWSIATLTGAWFAALLALPQGAGAQLSTRGLLGAKPNTVETSIGTEVLPFRDYGGNRAVAALAGVRHELDAVPVGIRVTGWWIHHGAGSVTEVDNIYAVTGALDFAVRLTEDAALEPYVGGGVAPYAESDFGGTKSSESTPVMAAGVTLRLRHVLIGQHAFIVSGAKRTITRRREFFPLTVGWRF
jgi:hypothetical protein